MTEDQSLEELHNAPPLREQRWVVTDKQEEDIGRDVAEREEHPLGDDEL